MELINLGIFLLQLVQKVPISLQQLLLEPILGLRHFFLFFLKKIRQRVRVSVREGNKTIQGCFFLVLIRTIPSSIILLAEARFLPSHSKTPKHVFRKMAFQERNHHHFRRWPGNHRTIIWRDGGNQNLGDCLPQKALSSLLAKPLLIALLSANIALLPTPFPEHRPALADVAWQTDPGIGNETFSKQCL